MNKNKIVMPELRRQLFSGLEVKTLKRSAEENGGTDGSEELYVEGIAAVFNSSTILFEYGGVEYKEEIDSRAFDGADMSDVIFNYNHSGKVMARTRNNTLKLWTENDGLHMRARLDGTAEGRTIYQEIQDGYIDRMSFRFTVNEESFNQEEHKWTVRKIKRLYDVSAVDIPAYDDTSIGARQAFLSQLETEKKHADVSRLRVKILKAKARAMLLIK